MQQGMARNALVVCALILWACDKPQAVVEVDGQCADPYQSRVSLRYVVIAYVVR